MRILHAATELFPLLKVGGLGDVLGALPQAQAALGAEVRVVVPGFPAFRAVAELDGRVFFAVERAGTWRLERLDPALNLDAALDGASPAPQAPATSARGRR